MEIIELLESVGSAILTPVILAIIGVYIKKSFDRMEARGNARVNENIVTMRYLQSLGTLTYATGKAVRDGKTNGEMTTALEGFEVRKNELEDFLVQTNAQHQIKG